MAIRARHDNLSLDHHVAEPAVVTPLVAFSELWAHREGLLQACFRMVGNEATAEDLVQETYLRALKSRAELDREQSPGPWLTTVARRRSIDELRSQRRLAVVETPPEPDAFSHAYDDPAQHVVNGEMVERLRSALAELSPRERQLLLRQVSHGLSLADMAAEESTSVASVRSVLARARQKIRMSLERGGVLGALPMPRLLASLRERLHRLALHAEGSLPLITGAGLQLGQIVVIVVMAVASLLAGAHAPPWPGTEVLAAASSVEGASDTGPADTHVVVSEGGGSAAASTTADVDSGRAPDPTLPVLSVDVPTLPDGADEPERSSVGSFTVSDDGSVVLATAVVKSTGQDTIYQSTDGGHSWIRLPATGYHGGRLLLPPAFPADRRIFAVGTGDIQISHDGGISFLTNIYAPGQGVLSPEFAAGDERILVSGPPAVQSYRMGDVAPVPRNALLPTTSGTSIDIGPGWETTGEVLVGTTTPTGLEPHTATVLSCTASECVVRQAFPKVTGTPRIIRSRATPGMVIASKGANFFRSTDGGMSFTRRALPAGISVGGVYEDPFGVVYLTGGKGQAASGLHRSTDYGDTWTAVAGTMVGPGTHAVVRLPSGRLIAALFPGGMGCSVDDGDTWHARCPA